MADPPPPRYCIACAHSVQHMMGPVELGIRLCCDQSGSAIGTDASLCGVMRLGDACGPSAKLYEAR